MTPGQLASELGVSPKTLRSWLRRKYPRSRAEHGSDWRLSPDLVAAARSRFAAAAPPLSPPARKLEPPSAATAAGVFREMPTRDEEPVRPDIWGWCQSHSDEVLAGGLQDLLAQPARQPSSAVSGPGVYLFSDAQDRAIYVGQSGDVGRRLEQHLDPDSKLSARLSDLGFGSASNPALRIRWLSAVFGRLELEEFAVAELRPPANRMRRLSRRPVGIQSSQVEVWRECQLVAGELIDAGARQAAAAATEPWGAATASALAGIYILRGSDATVLYVGESDNLAERYRTHGGDNSYFSALRRNVGRTELRLAYGSGLRRRFVPPDEERISVYLAACRLAIVPVALGRGEVEARLIRQLGPRLNRRR